MTAREIGSEGLLEADLVICQGATLAFAVEHLDGEGEPVGHAGWAARMRLIDRAGASHDLSGCVSFDGGDVEVSIPPAATRAMATGAGRYDLMLEEPSGAVTRLLHGRARVVDTYAMDGD